MKTTVFAVAVLTFLSGAPSLAAQGAIPAPYHGMWGAGGCDAPAFYFQIEASGIQGYGADKRSPVGDWDVRESSPTGKGVVFDARNTNTGKDVRMELALDGDDSLTIDATDAGSTDTMIFAKCSPLTQ